MEEQPNYFAIMPANVRYDNRLTPNAKLLFAEITALTNMNGKCFATNEYFAKLYDVDQRTISRWMSSLASNGYITIVVEQDENKQTVRHVQLCQGVPDKIVTPLPDKIVVHNNTTIVESNNNLTDSNIKEALEKWIAYKKERKQSYTKSGLNQCIEKLSKISNNDPYIAMQIVNESISNNWSGLFPLRGAKQKESVWQHNMRVMREMEEENNANENLF